RRPRGGQGIVQADRALATGRMRSGPRVSTTCAARCQRAICWRLTRSELAACPRHRLRLTKCRGSRTEPADANPHRFRPVSRASSKPNISKANTMHALRSACWLNGGRANCGKEALMIAVVWQFDVKAGLEREFEEFLGVNGEWTRLS